MKLKLLITAVALTVAGALGAPSAHADDTMVAMAYSPSTMQTEWVTYIDTTTQSVENHALQQCQNTTNSPCIVAGSTTGCMNVQLINEQWFVGYGSTREAAATMWPTER